MMRFFLTALGCKLNQAEADFLARQIEERGHAVVPEANTADWAVVNTCTVTHVAARKSRQLVRRLHRENPYLRIAVTGCFAEMDGDQVSDLEGVALVIGNQDKERVVDLILEAGDDQLVAELTEPGTQSNALASGRAGRTRAAIKIQDGCDNACSYCIVTIARGPQRSKPHREILEEARKRLAEGYRELVLTGVHIGAYGRDSAIGAPLPPEKGWSLARLVALLLDETPVERLRLSSIEPWDLSHELLALWQDPRLCRHIHLPLQSGSDTVLARMRRHYTSDDFRQLVESARRQIPELSLTTDVIVGFPGESPEEFEASYAFCQEMAFSRLHVFKYSRRPGTLADKMTAQVLPQEAQARSRRLITLGRKLATDFHRRLVSRCARVLFEVGRLGDEGQLWDGLTDNYVRVRALSNENLHNRTALVRCTVADAAGVRGEIVQIDTPEHRC